MTNPIGAGADGVDDDAGALRHFQRLAAGMAAQLSSPSLITTSTRRTSGAAPGGCGAGACSELLRSLVDGVVERRAAAGALLQDDVAQPVHVAGEILDHLGLVVHGHQEGLILVAPDDVEKKIDGRLLLELQSLANAVGGIQQQADAQRQIGLPAEEAISCGTLSSKTLKSSLLKSVTILFRLSKTLNSTSTRLTFCRMEAL